MTSEDDANGGQVNLPRVTAQGGVIMAVYDEDGGQVDLPRVAAQGGRWEARTTRKKGTRRR